MHGSSTKLGSEGIKPVDMPVGIVTGERRRHEPRCVLLGNAHPSVRERYKKRRVPALDREPGLRHASGPSRPGKHTPTVLASAPERTTSAAATMSDARQRTCPRIAPRA